MSHSTARPDALPIARLRAFGCKVSPVIGHDVRAGHYVMAVTPPAGVPARHLLDAVPHEAARIPPHGEYVVVHRSTAMRDTIRATVDDCARAGAATLSRMADAVSFGDDR